MDDGNVITFTQRARQPVTLDELLQRLEALEIKVSRNEERLWDIEVVTRWNGSERGGSAA